MTEREKKVLIYFTKKPHRFTRKHLRERTLLREAKLLTQLLDNCLVIREPAPSRGGVSDLLLCYNGRFVACELKAMDGVASPQQLKFIEDVKAAGGLAAVCESVEDIWTLIMQTAK